MTWLGKVVLVAVVAVFTVAAALACSSAIAQTEEELAAGFTEQTSHITNLYLPDGGTGVCQQFSVSRQRLPRSERLSDCVLP